MSSFSAQNAKMHWMVHKTTKHSMSLSRMPFPTALPSARRAPAISSFLGMCETRDLDSEERDGDRSRIRKNRQTISSSAGEAASPGGEARRRDVVGRSVQGRVEGWLPVGGDKSALVIQYCYIVCRYIHPCKQRICISF